MNKQLRTFNSALDVIIDLETERRRIELDVQEFDVERDFEHIELDEHGERRTRITDDE